MNRSYHNLANLVAAWMLAILANFTPAHAQVVQEEHGETVKIQERSDRPLPPAADMAEAVQLIVADTNQFRVDQQLSKVNPAAKLTETAQYFANYMAENDKYGHTADGRRPADRAKEHGYEYCIVLENIAYQYRSTEISATELATKFFEGWKNSPGHRKNMLDPDVTETGVAIARSDKTGYYYAVQMFGRPRSASIDFEIINRSGESVDYKLGDRSFELPPRYIRSHAMCRPQAIVFGKTGGEASSDSSPATPQGKSVKPNRGDRIVVEKNGGQIQIEQSQGKSP